MIPKLSPREFSEVLDYWICIKEIYFFFYCLAWNKQYKAVSDSSLDLIKYIIPYEIDKSVPKARN